MDNRVDGLIIIADIIIGYLIVMVKVFKNETETIVSGNFFKVIEEEIVYHGNCTRKYTLAHKEMTRGLNTSYGYVSFPIYTKEDLFNVGDTLKLVNF